MTYDPNHPQYAPLPPKRGMSTGKKVALGCGIPAVLGLLFLGSCAALAGSAVNEIDKSVKADERDDARAAKEDVKVTACAVELGSFGKEATTKIRITNHGNKRADYLVEGEFLDRKGNKLGDLLATTSNLAPGSSTVQEFGGVLITPDTLRGVTDGTCKVLKVSRDEWSAVN